MSRVAIRAPTGIKTQRVGKLTVHFQGKQRIGTAADECVKIGKQRGKETGDEGGSDLSGARETLFAASAPASPWVNGSMNRVQLSFGAGTGVG